MGAPLVLADLNRIMRSLPRLYAPTDLKGVLQAIFDITGELIGSDSRNFNDLRWIDPLPGRQYSEFHAVPDAHYEVALHQRRLEMFVAAAPVRTDLNFEEVCWGFERNILNHPTIVACRKKRDFHTFRLSDLVTERQFLQTPLYTEFYRHFPVRKLIVSYLAYADNREVVVALTREGGRDFKDRDCEVMRVLNPHIRQAWANARALDEARGHTQQSRALLAHERIASICLSREARVLWQSPAVRTLLAEFFPKARPKNSRLPQALEHWVLQHPLLKHQALIDAAAATPLRINSDRAQLEARLTIDPSGQPSLILKRKGTVLSSEGFSFPGLTRRESEVLFWISHGRTNSAIATLLSTSARTINKHVQNIFLKLGVANRAEAIVAGRSSLVD
jgi:DNA-binding CsgD family transcriptional regulator